MWGKGSLVLLCVDQIVQYHLLGSLPNAVHSLNPEHLILGFHLLGHVLGLRHLRHRLFDLFPRRPVDLQQMLRQPVLKQQVAEILEEAEKYIWRIKEEMRCA